MILYVVSCGAQKAPNPCPAASLYTGPLFTDARGYVEAEIARNGGSWRIMSALHGLLRPDIWIAPYDRTLTDELRAAGRAETVAAYAGRLAPVLAATGCDRIEVHAGALYADVLREAAAQLGIPVADPLRGREIGQRRQWYAEKRRAR